MRSGASVGGVCRTGPPVTAAQTSPPPHAIVPQTGQAFPSPPHAGGLGGVLRICPQHVSLPQTIPAFPSPPHAGGLGGALRVFPNAETTRFRDHLSGGRRAELKPLACVIEVPPRGRSDQLNRQRANSTALVSRRTVTFTSPGYVS
jgi:hypothetical protein